MRHRFLVSVGVLAIAVAVVSLATIPVAGQSATPTKGVEGKGTKAYTPPRTPDGQPDLQGFWTNSTYTPLERPANVSKEFYTPQEFEAVVKQAADRETEQT